MILELKPEHEAILEAAISSGRSREELLDEAFAHIRVMHEMDLWREENQKEIRAKIQIGLEEAARGELIPDHEVKRILKERHAAFLASHEHSV